MMRRPGASDEEKQAPQSISDPKQNLLFVNARADEMLRICNVKEVKLQRQVVKMHLHSQIMAQKRISNNF